jgi:hypothetical protein
VEDTRESLKRHTEALQERFGLAAKPSSAPVVLPATLSVSEFKLSPEVGEFLQNTRDHMERSRGVSVGMY